MHAIDLLQKRKAKLADWEKLFREKYNRNPTLDDVERYPKVKKIYQEIKTLSAAKNLDRGAVAISTENNVNNSEVILPTPSKGRSQKGLFKSLSSSNVLLSKRLAEAASAEHPVKKSKVTAPFASNINGASNPVTFAARNTKSFLEARSNNVEHQETKPFNAFGIKIKKAVAAPAVVSGVTIEEDEDDGNDHRVIKKLVAQEFHFGTKTAKANLPKSISAANMAKSLEAPKDSLNTAFKSPNSPRLAPSKNWRIYKPISTPLKKVVDSAMNMKPRAESFVAPHMFVNHRALKRAASLTLPLPSNYQDFLTKEEEKKFADIIREQDPNAVLGDDNEIDSEKPIADHAPIHTLSAPSNIVDIPNSFASLPPKAPIRKCLAPPGDDNSSVDADDTSSDDEEVRSSKRKQSKPTRNAAAPSARKTKNSKAALPAEKTGWDSKTTSKASVGGNQNYRKLNLKAKPKGGGRGAPKFGKNKFKTTKKLSSYNYKASDQQYLLAGYGEEVVLDQVDDHIVETALEQVDPARFLVPVAIKETKEAVSDDTSCLSSEIVCELSSKYETRENNVKVNLLEALKTLTGHSAFRQGQMEVVKRILEYKSSIFILPTGGGKSLCYQLPAFILRHVPKKRHSMVLVISPTISLMMDQLQCLPKGIRGACLSSSEQGAAASKVIEKLKQCEVDVLFVSPERLRSDYFLNLVQKNVISAISFVCVDEVHCLSEWSHNFRTSYLHLQSSLLNTLQVGCILGLTGTATIASQESICRMLNIDQHSGVISQGFLRDNLKLSASMISDFENRDASLVELLRSEPYSKFQSIIVYVMFQAQADKLAQYLRVRDLDADSYHAGKPPELRAQTQSRFLRGTLRILTATVAFGMGINKPNIDAVIHYCLPKSVENYIQETGRAGRDGREAHCHVFVSREDYIKHRSLVYSEFIDETNLMNFLRLVFTNKGNYIGIDIQQAEKIYDVKEGVMATILSYLELARPDLFQVLPVSNDTITIYFAKGTSLEDLCKEIDWFWEISKILSPARGGVQFNLIRLANSTSMMPRQIMSVFWKLQADKRIRFKSENRVLLGHLYNPAPVQVEFIRKICQDMHKKMLQMEQIRVLKLDETYEMLHGVAVSATHMVEEVDDMEERRTTLKTKMASYFSRSGADEKAASQLKSKWGFRDSVLVENQKICQMAVSIAIKHFVKLNQSCIESGRTVARIFHGINTPKFPAYEWYKTEYWAKFTHYNHVEIARIATKAILEYKGGNGN